MNVTSLTRSVDIPGYSGGSIAAKAHQYIRVIDVEGRQIGDLFAVSMADHGEFLSPSITRLHNGSLFPGIGEPFFTNRDRPMLTFVNDDSPGCHDMLYASCNREWYRSRGFANHPNCRDNYFEAAHAAGIEHVFQPDPVNIFQNTPPGPDGRFFIGVTMTSAGDSVTLRAEMDCIVVLTTCSSEPILGGRSTPMRLEVHEGAPPVESAAR